MKIKEYEDTSKNAFARKIQTTYEAKIDKSSAQLVMDMLAKLYSEPHRAVLREYVSNAYDANIEANATKPVEVHLPEKDEPWLSVRDYGKGLDYLGIVSVFANFGTSTKRDSDNLIGGFGIGSKSGLAVSDSIQVTSVCNSTLNEFVVERTPNGIITRFTKENEETTQDSGTTVTISYNDKVEDTYDENCYCRNASMTTTLCGWSKNEVFVTNPKYEKFNDYRIPDTWYFNGYEYRAPATEKINPHIKGFLIGKVLYNMPYKTLMSEPKVDYDATTSLIIPFDIKDIKVTYSREKIDFDDTDTLNRIKVAIDLAKMHAQKEYADIANDDSLKPYEKIRKLNNIGINTSYIEPSVKGSNPPIPKTLEEPAVFIKTFFDNKSGVYKSSISTQKVQLDDHSRMFLVFNTDIPKRPALKQFANWIMTSTDNAHENIKLAFEQKSYPYVIATTKKGYAQMYHTVDTPVFNVQAMYDALGSKNAKAKNDLSSHEFKYSYQGDCSNKTTIDQQWLLNKKVVFVHPEAKFNKNFNDVSALSKLFVPNPRVPWSDIYFILTKTKKEYNYLTNLDPSIPTVEYDDITAFAAFTKKWDTDPNIIETAITAYFLKNLMLNKENNLENDLWLKTPFSNQRFIERKMCTIVTHYNTWGNYQNDNLITKAYYVYAERYSRYIPETEVKQIIDHITNECTSEISMLQNMCDDLDKLIK